MNTYKPTTKVKHNKLIIYLKSILNKVINYILLFVLIVSVTSCTIEDSIDNYKDAVVVDRKQFRSLCTNMYYYKFTLKIYDTTDSTYRIIRIDCYDGDNYTKGDIIR